MSTSEAAASRISLVTEDPVPASSPKIQVLVIIGDPIVVYPANLQIPWDFAGTIVWTLASDDVNTVFTGQGVEFTEAAPYTVISVSERRCEASVNNDNPTPGVTSTPFSYDLLLTTGSHRFVIDPTVENDPPIVP
jgi:hypothetical protein